jgi:hypothetical protein
MSHGSENLDPAKSETATCPMTQLVSLWRSNPDGPTQNRGFIIHSMSHQSMMVRKNVVQSESCKNTDNLVVVWCESGAERLRGSTFHRRTSPVRSDLGPAPWYEWVQSLEMFDVDVQESSGSEQLEDTSQHDGEAGSSSGPSIGTVA